MCSSHVSCHSDDAFDCWLSTGMTQCVTTCVFYRDMRCIAVWSPVNLGRTPISGASPEPRANRRVDRRKSRLVATPSHFGHCALDRVGSQISRRLANRRVRTATAFRCLRSNGGRFVLQWANSLSVLFFFRIFRLRTIFCFVSCECVNGKVSE